MRILLEESFHQKEQKQLLRVKVEHKILTVFEDGASVEYGPPTTASVPNEMKRKNKATPKSRVRQATIVTPMGLSLIYFINVYSNLAVTFGSVKAESKRA